VNCTVIQRRLLAAERPEQPPAEIQDHLAQCPSCRLWQRRLLQTERLIPQLPVPLSTAKEQFLQRVLGPRPVRGEPAALAAGCRASDSQQLILHPAAYAAGSPIGLKERGLRKLSIAFTLAASLLVFALAWWSWPHNPIVPSEMRRLEQARMEQVKLEQRLSSSLLVNTPKDRVVRLAKLADEIHGEARALVDHSERLEQWSQFYSRVVGQHLIEQARQLAREDRQAVLADIALGLAKVESEATRLVTQCKLTAPRSAAAFHKIALVSQNGERDLRELMNG
jgi:hypothetical protein